MAQPQTQSKRIAIIGSGVSGLAALWSLRNTPHKVHLYEADSRLGGHTNTLTFRHPRTGDVVVDAGFVAFNSVTYVTMGVSRNDGQFEWANTSLLSIFAQRRNILNPQLWLTFFDMIRFNIFALDLLTEFSRKRPQVQQKYDYTAKTNGIYRDDPSNDNTQEEETVQSYLDRHHYSEAFRNNYLVPMIASVWFTPSDKCALHLPIVTLVRVLYNHHLLNTIIERPTWLTVAGGAKRYIDALVKNVASERIHLNTRVTEVRNIRVPAAGQQEGTDVKVGVRFEGDEKGELFDHVVLATHARQAYDLLGKMRTNDEEDILSVFENEKTTAVLHCDESLLPHRKLAWSAWNYLTTSTPSNRQFPNISITYNLSMLQHLPSNPPILVTLNPPHDPDPVTVQCVYEFSRSLYTPRAVVSQTKLHRIQNQPMRNISFVGAWTGYGLQEDGFKSGLRVGIEEFGGEGVPRKGWVENKWIRGEPPRIRLRMRVFRLILIMMTWFILLIRFLYGRLEKRWERSRLKTRWEGSMLRTGVEKLQDNGIVW